MEILIEILHQSRPFLIAFRHLVEYLFHTGGEIIVHDCRKICHQEVIHHNTDIRRQEFRLLVTGHFRLCGFRYLVPFQFQDVIRTLHTLLVAPFHISTLLDGGNGRCISGRASDAQFLQLAHKACFRITGRTLGEALGRKDFRLFQRLTYHQRRKETTFVFLFVIIIVRLFIDTKETVESHNLTRSDKHFITVTDRDVRGGLLQFRIRHLRSDCTFPNKFVKFLFLCRTGNAFVYHISGSDGFVCFLCPFSLGGILAGLDIVFTHQFCDNLTAGTQRQIRKVHRVGTHISDLSVFIQTLCDDHCLRYGEAQLAGSFLL